MFENVFLIIASIVISLVGIVYVALHHENYGAKITSILIVLIFFVSGILYFVTFGFSTDISLNKDLALIFFKSSIIIGTISLGMFSVSHSFDLVYNKINKFSVFLFSFLGGIIIFYVFSPNSIIIVRTPNYYIYKFPNIVLLIYILLFDSVVIVFTWYTQIKHYSNIRNKRTARWLNYILIGYTFTILTYTLYVLTPSIVLQQIHLIIFILGAALILYNVIRNPKLFISLTNKIYNLIIFHKSGILLYSFNFETGKEADETLFKGTILIGINHILLNFLNRKEQLNLIKMKDRDIILEYDNQYNYAILLTTNHKDIIIENAVKLFMAKFNEMHKEELAKINNISQLIDVSEFKYAKGVLKEFFSPYILQK